MWVDNGSNIIGRHLLRVTRVSNGVQYQAVEEQSDSQKLSKVPLGMVKRYLLLHTQWIAEMLTSFAGNAWVRFLHKFERFSSSKSWQIGEAHAPSGCSQWQEWHLKIAEIKPEELKASCSGSEDAANCLWLVTNSKPCPNCKSPIQKNEGCNHMKCSKVRLLVPNQQISKMSLFLTHLFKFPV